MNDNTTTSETSVSGGCHCGAVALEIAAPIRTVVNCHCTMCRLMNGSAFSTYVVVPREALSLAGSENLGVHSPTPRACKHFCGKCGTPVFNINDRYTGLRMVYLGAVHAPEAPPPEFNVYCESELEWIAKLDGIRRFPTSARGDNWRREAGAQ